MKMVKIEFVSLFPVQVGWAEREISVLFIAPHDKSIEVNDMAYFALS